MFRSLHHVVPVRCSVIAVALLTGLAPLRSAEVIDNFTTTNNLYIFGDAISLSAENNILTAERTAGSVDTGFDWRVGGSFSLNAGNAQSQFQITALQSLNSGYFVLNVLVFNSGGYLGEFSLQGDINATGTFGYDIAAAALQAGFTTANQWFPRIRITPYGSDDAGFQFGSFGAVAAASTLVDSGTLTVNATTSFGSGAITLTNGSQVLLTQSRTITNALAVGSGSSGILNAASGQTITYTGGISNNASTLIFAGSGGTHVVDATVGSVLTGSILAIDGSTVFLNRQNNYLGPTYVYSGGTLNLASTNALPTATALIIGADATAGTVNLQGYGQTIAALLTGGTSTNNALNLGTAALTVSGGESTTYTGTITGTGRLTKGGSGTLTFAGAPANTYSGTTTVSGGTLNLAKENGTTAIAGSIVVNSGATLLLSRSEQVSHTEGNTITLSGGTISRGSGVTETFGNLVLQSESTLDFGTGSAGSLAFGTYTPSSLKLVINHFSQGNMLFFRSDLGNSITNTDLFSFTNGGLGSYSWDTETGLFTITAIPEPSAVWAAALMIAAFVLLPRRRQRGRSN